MSPWKYPGVLEERPCIGAWRVTCVVFCELTAAQQERIAADLHLHGLDFWDTPDDIFTPMIGSVDDRLYRDREETETEWFLFM